MLIKVLKSSYTVITLLTLIILGIPFTPLVIASASSCDSSYGFQNGAKNFVIIRRSQRRGAKDLADILWQPADMLKDPSCYKVVAPELEIREEGNGWWKLAKVSTKTHGKAIKWSTKVKPCKRYFFRIRLTGANINTNEAILEIPKALEPLSKEQLLESGYTPDAPSGLKSDVNANDADLSWNPSECAESYEISYVRAGTGDDATTVGTFERTYATITSLKPCTRYDTFIYAILGNQYSETSSEFTTEPRLDAASGMEVEVTPGLDSVLVSWPTWKAVSCISEYTLKVCDLKTMECTDKETMYKHVGSPFLTKKIPRLIPDTAYEVHLQPVFNDLRMNTKKITFRTISFDTPRRDTSILDSAIYPSNPKQFEVDDYLLDRDPNYYTMNRSDKSDPISSDAICTNLFIVRNYILYIAIIVSLFP